MGLNKPSGQMYSWCWTWNPLGGRCLYECSYCYVKNKIGPWLATMGNPKYLGVPLLIEKEFNTKLVKPDDGKVIFVESNGDLFGYWVSSKEIRRVLDHCAMYDNEYLFQSKNPFRFTQFEDDLPENTILGIYSIIRVLYLRIDLKSFFFILYGLGDTNKKGGRDG